MNIEVILSQDDPKLGKKGQIVKVSQGFAQNYLFPKNLAQLATAQNRKSVELATAKRLKSEEAELAEAQEVAEKIKKISVTIEVQSGADDKLYGAVTTQEILRELASRGVMLEKKDIHLEHPIKELGTFEIKIKLHAKVETKLKVWVVKKT